VLALGLGGCAELLMLGGGGAAGAAGAYFGPKFLQPIAGFAAADARTALAWIEAEEKAGRLSAEKATQARACPTAVVALDNAKLAAMAEPSVEGTKGLIFHGTVRKYGPDHEAEMQKSVTMILTACRDLIPVGQGQGLSMLNLLSTFR